MNASTSRSVLVTGASTGIGRATALMLDQEGFRVFAGVRKQTDADSLRESGSASLTALTLDVTDPTSIREAVQSIERVVGERGLYGLVNNAGIGSSGPLEFVPLEKGRQVFEVNLFGLVAVTQAFLPLLRRAQGQDGQNSRIINMGSIGGRMAMPFIAWYNASKFAVAGVSESLRLELRPWNIHVALIEPGNVATPIWDKGYGEIDDTLKSLPAAGLDLYGPMMSKMRESVVKIVNANAVPPDVVAKAILHALTARKPRARYLVGRDARVIAVLKAIVPDHLRDRLIMRQLGIHRAS